MIIIGNFIRVEELLKNAINVNRQNDVGDTALLRASENGKRFSNILKYFNESKYFTKLLHIQTAMK